MELNTVVGKLQIRACDHQTLWPFWVGQVTVTADLPWPHVTNPVLLDPAKGYPSCSEMEAVGRSRQAFFVFFGETQDSERGSLPKMPGPEF